MNRVIVNSTPLIALAIVKQLHLLESMFNEVIVASSVYQETVVQGKGKPRATELARAEWLQEGTLGLLLAAYHAERLSREAAETAGRTLRDSSVRLSSRLLGWFLEQLNQEGIK